MDRRSRRVDRIRGIRGQRIQRARWNLDKSLRLPCVVSDDVT